MGRRGPPAKPTKLKLVQDTLRRDRGATNEAQPEIAIPEVPEHLSDEAKVEWGRVSHELADLGLLTRIDRAALAAYCQSWARWKESEEKLRETGLVVTTKARFDAAGNQIGGGNIIENPFYKITCNEREFMKKFMIEFGMTPASRSRINTLVDDSVAKPKNDKNYA
jgi:P27 family predicted phage terminase small subunit